MPAEYMECVANYTEKGISTKTAKARCAASYFKRHGITVDKAHKEGLASVPELSAEDIDTELVSLIMTNLEDLENMAATVAATEIKKNTTDAITNKQSTVISTNFNMLDEFDIVEITATMEGAKAYTSDGRAVVWTDRSLKHAEKTWALTKASVNHDKKTNYGRVIASFLDGHLLKMIIKVNAEMKEWINKARDKIGVSIEAVNVKINKNYEIVSATGSGVTFVFPPFTPACPISEGCGINGTVNVETVAPSENVVVEIKEPGDIVNVEGSVTNLYFPEYGSLHPRDMGDLIYTYTTSTTGGTNPQLNKEIFVPPHNINEEVKTVDTEINDIGGKMSDEEKPKTVCAKEHDRIVLEKDSQILAIGKELETLKATVAKFETEKKDALLKALADEGVDATVYKAESNETVIKVIEAIKAYKVKLDTEEPVDSGAKVEVTETKTNVNGTVFTETMDAAKKAVEDAAKAEEEKIKFLMEEKKTRGF